MTFPRPLSTLPNMKLFWSYFLPLLSLLFLSCVTEPKVNLNTPEGLFKLGNFYQKQERYEEAIAQYKALSNKFPYSNLAVDAELRVADCHYKKEEYSEAYAAFKTFKELHPKHPQMDYVTYYAAESLRHELPTTVDRDLSSASQAINYYEEVTALYPQSQYAKDSKEKRFKLIQMLADKELYIADFYFKQEKYLGALTRYELFLQSFPQNSRVPYGLYRAALAAKYINQSDRTTLFIQRLLSEYPQSDEARLAKREFPHVAR